MIPTNPNPVQVCLIKKKDIDETAMSPLEHQSSSVAIIFRLFMLFNLDSQEKLLRL